MTSHAATTAPSSVPAKRRGWLSVLLAIVLSIVFVGKVLNYVAPRSIRIPALRSDVTRSVDAVGSWYRNTPLFHTCGGRTRKLIISGGYVCTSGPDDSVYTHIFDTYPAIGGPRAAIYPDATGPSMKTANNLVKWILTIPRYPNYQATAQSDWATLNPYDSDYWRFEYYSLRPTIALVDAYVATGRTVYLDRLWSIDNSFLAGSSTSAFMWVDYHSVAFREMTLCYQWWTLREYHALTLAESTKLLLAIDYIASFLEDPNHYQPGENHGTNEIAALLLAGVDFPQLADANLFKSTALQRLSWQLGEVIDPNGVLIENSPYYQFYEMDKLWQIYQFTAAFHIRVNGNFGIILRRMINYATYVLQPNDSPPMLGASLETTIDYSGSFKQMAALDPHFLYVLTDGEQGTVPPQTSVSFAPLDQSFFRSGWGKAPSFTQQSFMTFNVGEYRTTHSQLDLLGITLYDDGITLLPPGGLYSYVYDAMHRYFFGTESHNDVMVDGRSQAQGSAFSGPLVHIDGFTYQSASTNVYDGVSDLRTVVMVDKNHFLIIDRLSSAKVHRYVQLWHLFPGARVERLGLTVSGQGSSPDARVTVSQLDTNGIALSSVIGQLRPPAGLCSERTQVLLPCEQLEYTHVGKNAAYTTLISAGPPDPEFSATYSASSNSLTVDDDGVITRLRLGFSVGKSEFVAVHHIEEEIGG